jgi:hypothetical protein
MASNTLEFRQLVPLEITELWQAFVNDIGLEHARQTYGKYWPRPRAWFEKVWAVSNSDNERVGWVSIRPDGVDPFVWQASGIFSQHRGHGYSKEILRWSSDMSKEMGFDVMLFEISNHVLLQPYIQYHIKRIFEKKIPGEFVAGFINTPEPGYTIFGIKRNEE